jgi:hypothetical protein
VKALVALPKLLRTPEDRRRLLDMLDRVEGRIEANEKQGTLLGEIRRLLAEEDTGGEAKAEPITVTLVERESEDRPGAVTGQGSARHARSNRRTRASS